MDYVGKTMQLDEINNEEDQPSETTGSNPGIRPGFRPDCKALAFLILLFLITRLFLLSAFPVFNDEALYIDRTQSIHEDWDKNKYMSMINDFSDWKPPLPLWIGSHFVELSPDPVFNARLVSVIFSTVGVLSIYFLGGFLFSSTQGAFWGALFWTLNPMVLFYDREFVAETFVYSFSAATFLFTYLAASRHRLYILPAALAGASTLLSKQSGMLMIMSLPFLMLLFINPREGSNSWKDPVVKWQSILAIPTSMVLAYALYRLIIPAEALEYYSEFNSGWTYTAKELLTFPTDVWFENAKRVFALYWDYYSLFMFAAMAFFIYVTVKERSRINIIILLGFLFCSSAVIFGLKSFNEYIYNTAVVVFMTLALTAATLALKGYASDTKNAVARRCLRHSLPLVFLVAWLYPLPTYYTSPASYIQRFGTPWMVNNYLKGWPGGFGIDETLEMLEKEKEKIVLLDQQWGNPGKGIIIYKKNFPELHLMPMGPEILDILRRPTRNTLIVVFKNISERKWDDELLAHPVCKDHKVYQLTNDQVPLITCRY